MYYSNYSNQYVFISEPVYADGFVKSDGSIIVPDNSTITISNGVISATGGGGVATSVIGPEENGSTASKSYSTGEYFVRDDRYCKAISSIASGTALTKNTNYVESSIEDEMSKENILINNVSDFPTNLLDFYTPLTINSSTLDSILTQEFAQFVDANKITINTKIYLCDTGTSVGVTYRTLYILPLIQAQYPTNRLGGTYVFGVTRYETGVLHNYIWLYNISSSSSSQTVSVTKWNNYDGSQQANTVLRSNSWIGIKY